MSILIPWPNRWRRGRHTIPELALRRRGRRLAFTAVVFALVAVAVPVAVRAGTPGSSPGVGQWVGGKVVAPGPEQLVLWKLPGTTGVYGTCIDANRPGPLRGPYTRTRIVHDPVYGELNHLYANPSTSDTQLAQLSALNSRAYDRVNRATQWSYLVNKQGGLSVADAAAMLDRATQLAGPYIVTVALPADVRSGPVYVATVSVRSAANNLVQGATVRFSAVNATLRSTTATTDSLGRVHVAFTVPRGRATSYTLRASVQSWTDIAQYSSPGEQTMLTVAPPTTQSGAKTAPIVRDRPVTLVKAAADDPGHTPVAGYTFRITDATGAVVLPSVVSGSAPVSLGRLTMGAAYTATEIARPAGAELYIPVHASLTFTVPDGSSAWPVLAQDPRTPVPALSTQVSTERALLGDRLTDRVTIAGDDGEDGTVDAVLYGPVAPPAGGCGRLELAAYRAARATHVLAAVSGSVAGGNGVLSVTSPPITAAGCYGWAETLALRPSGASASSPPTAPHEATLVSSPPLPVPRHPAPGHPIPGHPVPPAMPHPPHTVPAPHVPARVPPTAPPTVPPLAQTGALVPVTPTVLAGLGLIALGVATVLLAPRGRRG